MTAHTLDSWTKGFHRLDWVFLSVLCFPILFLKLDAFPIRWWDESLFAVNAYEMRENGNYFALCFNGQADLFNTKPPLQVWLQVLSIRLFGYNELAIRIPSALAAWGTVLLVFFFLKNRFNHIWAWCASLILLTSFGFVHFHTARTGDADALLTFFTTAAFLQFLLFIQEKKQKHILLFFLFTTLGAAAKLYAALLFVPGIMLFLLYSKNGKAFVYNRAFILGSLLFVGFIGSILLLREMHHPGYLSQILFKDAGRLIQVVETHNGSSLFYIHQFFYERYTYWLPLVIIGILLTWKKEQSREQSALTAIAIGVLSYLLIISISVTKLEWYDMPMYPLMAILAAYPLVQWTQDHTQKAPWKQVILIILVFAMPYGFAFQKSQNNGMSSGEKLLEANERYLFKAIKSNKNIAGLKVYNTHYNGGLLFYKYRLKEIGQEITILENNRFQIGDHVLVSEEALKDTLRAHYNLHQTDGIDHAAVFEIMNVRE